MIARKRVLVFINSHSKELLLVCVAASGIFICGCGGQPATPATPATPTFQFELHRVELEGLPTGDLMPPLDGDRIELADPKGWERFPRSKDYVARFYLTKSNLLPRIIILAEDSPYPGITDITADNHEAFWKAIRKEVGDKQSLMEVPLAVAIGENLWVRYVVKATLGVEAAERQVLVTVVDGRKYEIRLEIKPKTIHNFKKASYAVAGSLRKADAAPSKQPKKE